MILSHTRVRSLAVVLIATIGASIHAEPAPLPTADPAAAAFDPESLERVAARARNSGSRALLVMHHGRLVAERYFAADDAGSLLDNGIYLLGSGMGDPNVHNHTNLPIVVAGGGSGKLQGGRHIKYSEPTPMANLLLTLMDKNGVAIDKFADSTGKIQEL